MKTNFIKSHFWSFVAVALTGIYLLHFTNTNNDFQIFYKAGRALLSGDDPWKVSTDPYAMYLNGPITGSILAFLSLLPLSFSIFLVRLGSLAGILVAFTIFPDPQAISHKRVAQIYSVILLSFSIRSNLEYGQMVIIFSVLFFYLIRQLENGGTSNIRCNLGYGAISAVLVDFKPQIFFLAVILLLIYSRFQALLMMAAIHLLFYISYVFLLKINPWTSWIAALSLRRHSMSQGDDQMSLPILLTRLSSSWVIGIGAIVLVSIYVTIKSSHRGISFFKRDRISFLIIPLGLLATPFLHPTDLVVVMLLVMRLSLLGRPLNSFFYLFVGCSLVWSPSLYVSAISFIVAFFCLSDSFTKMTRTKLLSVSGLMVLPLIVYLSLIQVFPEYEPAVRHWINLSILPLALYVLLENASQISRKVNKSSVDKRAGD
jgi:hypothetical protein